MSEYQLHRSFAPASSWSSERIAKVQGRWNVLVGKNNRGIVFISENDIGTFDSTALTISYKPGVLPFGDENMLGIGVHNDYRGTGFYQGKSSNYQQWRLYEHISSLLSTDTEEFSTLPSVAKYLAGQDNVSAQYRTFSIPKRSGDLRLIDAPVGILTAYQKQLLGCLTHLSRRHKACHGFEPERSIVTHAKKHVRKRFLLTIDIEDFFPTITSNRIYGLFRAKPFNAPSDVARYLTNLTTFKGRLPQGAPTSPILANLICRSLDSKLFKWGRNNGWEYSRYADDMAFSTQKAHIDDSDLEAIQHIVEQQGFNVNVSKTKLRHSSQRQMVTGLIVNNRLNIKREYLRNLRALLFNINTFGWYSQTARKQLINISKDEYDLYFSHMVSEIPLSLRRQTILRTRKDQHILLGSDSISAGLRERIVADETTGSERKSDQGAHHLAQRIHGRIQFVEQVRGESDLLVQNLWRVFEASKERLSADTGLFIPKKGKSTSARLRVIINSNKGTKEGGPKFDYSAIRKDVVDQLSIFPELVWLCNKSDRPGFISSLYNAAETIDLRPEDTRRFFELFEDYKAFRGLLHGASVLDNGRVKLGPKELFVEEILGVIQRVSSEYPIPSALSSKCLQLVSQCREWAKQDSSNEKERIVHPYNDSEFRTSVLDVFKRNTRFDRSKDSIGHSCTLKSRIQSACATIPQDRVTIEAKGKGPTFYGDVPSLISGISTIVSSMVQHTNSKKVSVALSSVGQDEGRWCEVKIYDEGSLVTRAATVADMFTGELQEAVRNLRGLLYWKVTAEFETGHFELDVMGGTRPRELQKRKNRPVEHVLRIPIK